MLVEFFPSLRISLKISVGERVEDLLAVIPLGVIFTLTLLCFLTLSCSYSHRAPLKT